jgi:DNA-binding CsgD family transcriptional regulator
MVHHQNGNIKTALLRWSLYGLAAGVLAAGMVWIKYRFIVLDHAIELYGLIVAGIFIALGIWLGLRLSKPKTIIQRETIVQQEIVVKEVRVLQTESAAPELRAASMEETGVSAREMEVLSLLCKGCSNAEIAEQLFVSSNTVKTHVSNLLFKLDVKRRAQVAERARMLGLI